jgi:DNA polymerase (family 10)
MNLVGLVSAGSGLVSAKNRIVDAPPAPSPRYPAMAKLEASEVADLLLEIGRRASLEGGNPYKAKAYVRAAESLRNASRPLAEIVRRGELRQIPGVGDAIAERISNLHRTGADPTLTKMRAKLPASVLDLLAVPGLRPDKVLRLHALLGVRSLGDLEEACRDGRLERVKGLGPALQRKISQGLEILRTGRGRLHMHRAAEVLEQAISELRAHRPDLTNIQIAGDLRRGCEVVADLRLVATSKARGTSEEQLGNITLQITRPEWLGAVLVLATGNAAHLAMLQELASAKGLTITLDGLKRDKKVIPTPAEGDVYKRLSLPFIEAELREGEDEIRRAKSKKLPRLIQDGDLRGIIHAHTDMSDGVHTLEQMAEAARKIGHQYIGITDHSQSAHYAGGLSVEEIEQQHIEIDILNARYGSRFRILKGIESDIRPDGTLDYPDEVLARFDFVIASVHGQFRLDRVTQTARLIRAVSHPRTTILGHPTGRQLLRRPGYDVDLDAVLRVCAQNGVAVEINANPYRLELDWRWHQRALQLGCLLSIDPDAHSVGELRLVRWGVAIARKGMVQKKQVLSCFTRPALLAYLAKRKYARTRPSKR